MSDTTDLLKSHLSDGNFILNMSVVVTFVDIFQSRTTRSKEVADFIGYDPFTDGNEVQLTHVGGGTGKLLMDGKPSQNGEAN